jgi:hypothetical protein
LLKSGHVLKSPPSAFREATQGLNLLNVRLGLSKVGAPRIWSLLRSHPVDWLHVSDQKFEIVRATFYEIINPKLSDFSKKQSPHLGLSLIQECPPCLRRWFGRPPLLAYLGEFSVSGAGDYGINFKALLA